MNTNKYKINQKSIYQKDSVSVYSESSQGLLLLLFPWTRNFTTIASATQLLNREQHTVYQLNLAKLLFGDSLKNYSWRNFNLAIY